VLPNFQASAHNGRHQQGSHRLWTPIGLIHSLLFFWVCVPFAGFRPVASAIIAGMVVSALFYKKDSSEKGENPLCS